MSSSAAPHQHNPLESERKEARSRVQTIGEAPPIDQDSQFLHYVLDDPGKLVEKAAWKDVGNGVRLGELARAGKARLVLYEIAETASADAFSEHLHPGGEVYIVLEGEIVDEYGTYPQGSFVWLGPQSVHTPRANGKTLILVFWPLGVKMLPS